MTPAKNAMQVLIACRIFTVNNDYSGERVGRTMKLPPVLGTATPGPVDMFVYSYQSV